MHILLLPPKKDPLDVTELKAVWSQCGVGTGHYVAPIEEYAGYCERDSATKALWAVLSSSCQHNFEIKDNAGIIGGIIGAFYMNYPQ